MTTQRKRLTAVEQGLRWGGLAAVLVGVGLGVTESEVLRPLGILLFFGGVGCYIAMGVMAYVRKPR